MADASHTPVGADGRPPCATASDADLMQAGRVVVGCVWCPKRYDITDSLAKLTVPPTGNHVAYFECTCGMPVLVIFHDGKLI